ncbi:MULTISPECIES: phospholipase D-like domain-containing protein [unclassified Variovorax]|uniref:phospholipase D-like domain-containing protein n=1 Tax=unclassified Variovorax TaxID=663243 RepID=UPI003F44E313
MARFTCFNPICRRTVESAWKPPACPHCKGGDMRQEVQPAVLPASKPVVRALPLAGKATASTSSGTAVTPFVPRGPIQTVDLLVQVFDLFDERTVGFLARVCRNWHAAAGVVLRRYVADARGFGSGSGLTMKSQILGLLANTRNLSLAVDKFMPVSYGDDDSILAYIVKHRIKLTLKLGTPNQKLLTQLDKASQNPNFIYKRHEIQALRKKREVPALLNYQAETVTQFGDLEHELHGGHVQTGLMHNKFWILDNNGIVTGSPNVSFSAMEGGNFESCIYIRSAKLAPLYQRYFQLLSTPYSDDSVEWQAFEKQVTHYNRNSTRVKAAFAPTVNISDFIVDNLHGAVKITVRQFLVSTAGIDDDTSIVPVLCGMAEQGADIEVFLDEAAYDKYGFVQKAALRLMQSGGKVYLQTPVTVVGGQERLQHDKLILATFHNGVKRTLLGSAGATVSVIANINAENFLCLDLPKVYDELMKHHQNTQKGGTTKALLL